MLMYFSSDKLSLLLFTALFVSESVSQETG